MEAAICHGSRVVLAVKYKSQSCDQTDDATSAQWFIKQQ